ncbi:MAG TPA: metal ABC transporter ATP-binding protein [Rhabdochlamydiaceae bacterium]|nr:metal ABC transporter ATP-binding protein [Rhabdochlamydiaceae bacterium]
MKDRNDPALKVEYLSVNYDKTPILWEVGFEIPAGQLVGIIGPNGAGKSTLLKALLGMVAPIAGKVEFFGKPLKKVKKQIAYVPQRTSVDWDFPITVREVVLMGRYHKLGLFKWASKEDKKAAVKALEMVGMEPFASRQISELSGGQQQRVFIARALAQDADIYFMDEPFAGVDMATEKAMILLLNELKKQGKTLFIVHHDLNSVEQYFDYIVLLNTCLIAYGPTQQEFNVENIRRTYGKSSLLLEEAKKKWKS